MGMRIFIVEDDKDTRDMLAQFITHCAAGEVCGTAASGEEALAKLEAMGADLVLIDISLPKMSGIDFLREAKTRWPALPCLILSAYPARMYARRVVSLGASGYVTKGEPEQLLDAIPRVLAGETYLSFAQA
jgi:DNA-binding NarL/FixJ family response regulator